MIIQRPKPPTRDDIGRQRVRRQFAWWPCRLEGYRWCWAETYLELWEVQARLIHPYDMFMRVPAWVSRGRYALGDDLPSPTGRDEAVWL